MAIPVYLDTLDYRATLDILDQVCQVTRDILDQVCQDTLVILENQDTAE